MMKLGDGQSLNEQFHLEQFFYSHPSIQYCFPDWIAGLS